MAKGEKKDMGNLFVTFLLIIIGLSLTGTVADTVTTAVGDLAAYTAAAALVALVPLFWVIIILSVGVAAIYVQMKGGW